MKSVLEHNRRAWDERVSRRARFTKPLDVTLLKQPLREIDRHGWLGREIVGRRVLCLASGGGRQALLYAAAGARVTVVDISARMLALDRRVASECGLDLHTVEASMDDLSMLPAHSFDIIVQPVSSCYVPELAAVYREVARVVVLGGLYVSQHKQPTSLQTCLEPSSTGYEIREPYFREGALPQTREHPARECGTLEFLHRWDQLIGELCRSGFVLEDLSEPYHANEGATAGSFEDRSRFVAPYVRLKARRIEGGVSNSPLWVP